MGLGRYKNGKFDLVVVANFPMSATDFAEWERGLKKASEILYDASEGQMQFGSIYVCDENVGADTAEFILHNSGDPSYGTFGLFGTAGQALHLMPYVRLQPLTVLHEMGHHVWRLGEEYAAPAFFDAIDKTNPAPDRHTIPITSANNWGANDLVTRQASAILKFGSLVERRTVTANTATTVTVSPDFPDLPTNSSSTNVQYQTPAECSTAANSNFCIMEKSRGAAGSFDTAGTWHPVANPVTEFCTTSNHDPDNDTQQDDLYNKSCWEKILDRAEFSGLTIPSPAAASGPTTGSTTPDWIVLDKQPRFALVLDRSGSMASGNKMADAQHGAVYWLEYCAAGTDLLSVIWYDHAIDRILNLTEVDTLPSLTPTINAINALAPRGSTNIRDGLFSGLDQIQSLPTRAAVQVTLLLTDGIHNTPTGSSASEVLPDFENGGVRIYALGVGTPQEVDMNVLDELAEKTGGKSYAVGDNQASVVETRMVEINAEVRGGIITTAPSLFPDSTRSAIDHVLVSRGEPTDAAKRPPLKVLLKALKLARPIDLVDGPQTGRVVTLPVDVEKNCLRASFTLLFPPQHRLWLYLIDPGGAAVDMSAPAVHLRPSAAPHEFAIVDGPAPGRWYVVAVRPEPGQAFEFRAVAGGENRNLQVAGGATPRNASGAPVRIWAKARWTHELSGLVAKATVMAPDGSRTKLKLLDEQSDDEHSGQYEGFYTPPMDGRFQGVIEVRCDGNAVRARWEHLLSHGQARSLGFVTRTPPFVRQIPFYFDVGPRPEVRDVERARGLVEKYQPSRPRPVKLRSAALQKVEGKTRRARRRRK